MPRRKTDSDGNEVTRALMEVLRSREYRPIPQRELLHRAHVPGKDRSAARGLIRRLIAEGKMRKIRGGRLVLVPDQVEVHGILERPRRGFARVMPEDSDEKVFVAPHHLGGAFSGDRVALRVVGRGRDGLLYGEVAEILEERSGVVLGVFRARGRGGVVQPLDPSMGDEIQISAAMCGDAADLHAVRVEIVKSPRRRPAREGQVLESLGHLDEPGTDVQVVVHKYELAMEFPEAVLAAADGLPDDVGERESSSRERFDDPAPVTIDGETAQDFDDAIAVQELGQGGFRLFVHIADVSHFVPEDSVLDLEARRRGTSVYFPGRVLPMFHGRLSNDLCSLRPGKQRLVQSVIFDLNVNGEVRKVRFADGIIRSAARLTYTQVAQALEGKGKAIPREQRKMLEAADRLRGLLERRRHARGSIDFDLPEPQILLDVEGVMTGIVVEPRNHAHRMIEEFMLLANEAVAEHLEGRNAPCMYRVHDPPDPTKLAQLASFVAGFGLELHATGDTLEPGEIQRMLERVEGRPEYRVISQVALRSMKQARYSPENTGHFGLASAAYSHFTSPIRRYPDLVVHRQLRATRRRRSVKPQAETPEALWAVADSSSELERNAEAAERELLVWKKVAFIADRVGETFEGLVTGVTRFGLFVQLVDNLVEGLIRIELLGEEWFEFDEGRFELRGADSGKLFRLGDRLRVRVDRVDRVLLRVDFSPEEAATAARPGRRSGRKRRVARGC